MHEIIDGQVSVSTFLKLSVRALKSPRTLGTNETTKPTCQIEDQPGGFERGGGGGVNRANQSLILLLGIKWVESSFDF